MKIAYLTNLYPAVSHSFIRREILALEGEGHEVRRFSVRRPSQDLPDPRDRQELERTAFILDAGMASLLAAAAGVFFRHPLRALSVAAESVRAAPGGLRQLARALAYFAEACFLLRCLRKDPVDHLHAHFGTNPTTVARLVWKLGGPRYSFTTHGPDEFDAPIALDLGAKVADSAFAVAISSYGKSQLMRWSAVEHWHKIHIVRCGVDELFLRPGQASLPNESRNLCCVARLAPQKGIPLLIDAAAVLQSRGVEFTITIVGDGELRPLVEAGINRHGLQDRVRLAGSLGEEDVRRHILASRAMILPSFAEGLPVVLMEALALGRPVIASAIAGTPELVDAQCGWLVPAGDTAAVADAMAEALELPADQLSRMGAVGQARVLDRHDSRRNAAHLRHLFENASGSNHVR